MAAVSGLTLGGIVYVHSVQTSDRARMHRAVLREEEEEEERARRCREAGGVCGLKPGDDGDAARRKRHQ